MRKLLLLLALFFTLNSSAQTKKYYADVWIYENYDLLTGLIDKNQFGIRAIVDIDMKHFGFISEKDSVDMKFNTPMEPVNYLAERGWTILAVPERDLPIPYKIIGSFADFPEMTHYIMYKEAISIEEATNGLFINFNVPPEKEKKPRVRKEVKDGKTYYKFNKERN